MDPVQAIRARFAALAQTEQATATMLDRLPEGRFEFQPAPGARTLGELVAHLYGAELATLRAFEEGELSEDQHAADQGPPVTSRAQAFDLMRRAHQMRAGVLAGLTPAKLVREVALFYGTFSGAQVIGFVHDEHWHHRGQLTVYLRCLGLEPPFLYGS